MQVGRVLKQLLEGRGQLVAVSEDRHARKDVETKPRARHRHDETAHVAQVTHCLGADQGEKDVVVLTSLETKRMLCILCKMLDFWENPNYHVENNERTHAEKTIL